MSNLAYTVGKLAQASDTKTVTIRYYEREGLMPSPPRTRGGYRLYSDAHLDRLLFIRRSRRLGFSLDSVKKLLEIADRQDAPCANVDIQVAQHLSEVRERLAQLGALEAELQRLSACCKGEGVIRNCRIIEALSGNGSAPQHTQEEQYER